VKGSHQPPRSANQKRGTKKTVKAPVFRSEIVAKVGRQIHDRWPNLGGQLASLVRVSRAKIDDLYSSAVQAMSECKEAFDDRRAARKAQDQVGIRSAPKAGRGRRAARASTGNGSAVSPKAKRTSSSSKSRS
jgi:hypothetical protein